MMFFHNCFDCVKKKDGKGDNKDEWIVYIGQVETVSMEYGSTEYLVKIERYLIRDYYDPLTDEQNKWCM